MMYVNNFRVTGYLGSDLKYTESSYVNSSGEQMIKKTARFSMATTKSFTDAKGNKREKTLWSTVFLNNGLAEYAKSLNLKKGSGVIVHGEIELNDWEDDKDVKRVNLQIVADFLLKEEKMERANMHAKESAAADMSADSVVAGKASKPSSMKDAEF